MSHILVISTSLQARSNSDILAEHLSDGVNTSGPHVDCVSLKGKTAGFCRGILACRKTPLPLPKS